MTDPIADEPLRTLIVDDEALARARLRTQLAACKAPAAVAIGEAAEAGQALALLAAQPVDLLLLDVHMPGLDGVQFARQLRGRPDAPAVVFVTAHAGHAVTAFELEAVDYLTKPVRVDRLQQALHKAARHLQGRRALRPAPAPQALLIHDRGRLHRVPVADVLYLKSEFKYLTVYTAQGCHIFDGTLGEMEERYPQRFVRVHRSALVARHAIRALERRGVDDEGEAWVLRLAGIDEPVAVSRRQLSAVREVLRELDAG